MRMILLKDVPKVGKKYDIKDFSDGYAINYLIPKGLAMRANKSSENEIEKMKQSESEQKKKRYEELRGKMAKIEGVVIKFQRKANQKGTLFSSIGKEDVADELSSEIGLEIDAEEIILDDHIKDVGEFEAMIKIEEDQIKFKILVEKEP